MSALTTLADSLSMPIFSRASYHTDKRTSLDVWGNMGIRGIEKAQVSLGLFPVVGDVWK